MSCFSHTIDSTRCLLGYVQPALRTRKITRYSGCPCPSGTWLTPDLQLAALTSAQSHILRRLTFAHHAGGKFTCRTVSRSSRVCSYVLSWRGYLALTCLCATAPRQHMLGFETRDRHRVAVSVRNACAVHTAIPQRIPAHATVQAILFVNGRDALAKQDGTRT